MSVHFDYDLEQVKVRELLLAQTNGPTDHAMHVVFFDELEDRLIKGEGLEAERENFEEIEKGYADDYKDLEHEKASVEGALDDANGDISHLEGLLSDAKDDLEKEREKRTTLREKLAELLLAEGEPHTPREDKIVALVLAED